MRLLRVVLGAALLSLAATGLAATLASFPERGRAAVVDAANVIPDDVETDLNGQIVAWNRATGHQLVVATVPSLQGLRIQDYGTQLLRHWRLGRAEANDGAILLLAPSERQVRIEVGYGLEPVLTDARTSMIIQETIRPALAGNDIQGALTAGAKRIMEEASAAPAETAGVAEVPKAGSRQADPPFPIGFFLVIGAVIGGIVLLVWRGRRRELSPEDRKRRRYATVPRAEQRAAQARSGNRSASRGHGAAGAVYSSSTDPLMALQERAQSSASSIGSYDSSSSSSWDSSSSSSSSSDSGFDSGGGSGGGGGSDSNY